MFTVSSLDIVKYCKRLHDTLKVKTRASLVNLTFAISPPDKLLPAALRAAQTCRYLIYSDADFEGFRPTGATRCTDGVKLGTEVPSSVPNFTPIGATTRV